MNENQNNNREIPKHEVIITHKGSRRGLKILLGILGVAVLGGIAVGIMILRDFSDHNRRYDEHDYMVFAENLNLVKKVSGRGGAANFEVVRQLPFGTLAELHTEAFLQQDEKSYYECNHYRLAGGQVVACDKNVYLEVTTMHDVVEEYAGENMQKVFPVKEAQQLPLTLRHSISEYLGNTYNDGYYFTQDANRIGSSIVKADFNLDGADDYAVVLQYGVTNPSSNLMLVLCYNPDIKKYYVAFSDYNSGLASIGEFDKGARIFTNTETLVNAPNNGFIYNNQEYESDFGKYAVLYDPKLKEFKQYRQVPLSQQPVSMEDEEYYDEHVDEVFCEPEEEEDEDYG